MTARKIGLRISTTLHASEGNLANIQLPTANFQPPTSLWRAWRRGWGWSWRRGLLRDDVIILQDDGIFIAENVA